jgi:uncharacterized protein YndB with AHSA1/START domain
VKLERVFNAPVEQIWSLWTDPEHFRVWYGPMRMWFAGEYVEVIENHRLVYTEFMADETGAEAPGGHPSTQVIIELDALDGQTKVTLTHVGIPADSPGATGWTMALDGLAAYVETKENTA